MVTILLMLKYVLLSFMFKPFMGGFFMQHRATLFRLLLCLLVFMTVYILIFAKELDSL